MTELINSGKGLRNSVRRSVKGPNHTLELHNESKVSGFTAATKSAGDAGSSRGQHANMLVFDEADYLDKRDIDTALAVMMNFPDATIWMSSTPSGQRSTYYDTCYDSMFREFYFPSTVNPNWNEDTEKFYRRKYTAMGYKHEILAEFGELEEGVYQLGYIEQAQFNYNLKEQKPVDGWIYSMGVDWNDVKIGTTICVMGWCPGDRKFYVVDKQIIQKEGYTQLAAVQKVMEMNRLWRPHFIYIDRGFGYVQAELLHKFGNDAIRDKKRGPQHQDAKLSKIVKSYDFGSSIEVKDPFTKQLVKKPAKAFMVESSVRLFEAGDIRFPADDEKLKKALLGYKIKRVSQSGVPVYEQSDENAGDHELDAMNLAIVAYVLEESEFGTNMKYSSYITHIAATISEIAEQNEHQVTGPVSRTEYRDENSRVPGFHINKRGGLFPRIYSHEAFIADRPLSPNGQHKPMTFLGRHSNRPQRKKF